MRSDRIFSGFFSLLVANEIVAGHYRDTFELWYLLSKPLLLLSIIIYFVAAARNMPHALRNWLLLGFFFSWLGDISLMFQNTEPYFLLGLASFFLAHVCYIMAFRLWIFDNMEIPLLKRHPWMIVLLVLYGIGYFRLLEPGLGQLKIPVIAYMAVIVLMVIMALNRFKKVTRRGYAMIVAGAFLFLLSDSILAYNKFIDRIDFAGIWIMITYSFAQLLIMRGGISELRGIWQRES
jgi:uncharacterized membrane protein YhhN